MVSFKEATKPVSPIKMNTKQEELFNQSLTLYKAKRFPKAKRLYMDLYKDFSSEQSEQSKASAFAMISNANKMRARRLGEKSKLTHNLLQKALQNLNSSLKIEPYWAEYVISKGKLKTYIHQRFGCVAPFDGKVWTTSCYKVSKALGLPGISPGMTQSFECSICGKDPVSCDHVLGKIYDGKIALAVAKDIKFDHISIVDEPMQLETYILPRPLTKEMLKRILPPSTAEAVIAHRKVLTCRDLLEAIRKHRLRGIDWRSQ